MFLLCFGSCRLPSLASGLGVLCFFAGGSRYWKTLHIWPRRTAAKKERFQGPGPSQALLGPLPDPPRAPPRHRPPPNKSSMVLRPPYLPHPPIAVPYLAFVRGTFVSSCQMCGGPRHPFTPMSCVNVSQKTTCPTGCNTLLFCK